MTDLAAKTAQPGPACRHWKPLLHIHGENGCLIGHPIAEIVTKANGGDSAGLFFMLPCRPGPEAKAKCPDYDPRTPEELAAIEAEMNRRMDAFVRVLPAFNTLREEMVAAGELVRTIDCPWCGAAEAVTATCAIGINNHMHAHCSACKEGFIE